MNDLCENIVLKIRNSSSLDKDEYNFLKSSIQKNVSLFAPFLLNRGFNRNYNSLDVGNDTSNQGAGAELIFVAKAMIAGFNASVVQVGSSPYDAVIENNQKQLLKVQVKSFTDDNFSRSGRARGGEGIDSTNRRNQGRLVTSMSCDMFVAVNKINGELFIFAKQEIDQLSDKPMKRVDYMDNWENWSKINETKL